MSKKPNELESISLMFYSKDMLKSEAEFKCYADGIFSYYVEDDKGYTYELNFIADDMLTEKMEIIELLTLKRLKYFSCKVFDFGENLVHSYDPYNTIINPEIEIKK